MKKYLIMLIFLSVSASVFSRPVYIFQKEGGEFTFNLAHGFYIGYNTIDQTTKFLEDVNGNPVEQITVSCKNPGDERCRANNSPQGVIINNNSFDPLVIDEFMSEINRDIDDKVINQKIIKGSINKKVMITSKEGNQCLLSFDATWDLNENGDGQVIIGVNEVIL